VWTGQPSSRREILPTAREIGARDSQRKSSGQEADPPSSLRCRAPFQSETALPEANSFPSECQPFCNIGAAFHGIARGSRWRVGRQLNIGVMPRVQEAKFDPANAAAYPRLVARKSAIRLRSAQYATGPAPVTSETQSLPGLGECNRVPPASVPGRNTMPDSTRRESWQRASGPSSRITGAEPACTASGCGCVLGQVGRSCQTGVARAAAR
jgi:hypothetical protein